MHPDRVVAPRGRRPDLERTLRSGVALGVAGLLVALLSACVPKDLSNHTEVGGARDVVDEPPRFPETGRVPDDLLVEGLVYDFTNHGVDLNLWSPDAEEARCAATAIVELYGEQLSDLGYEPGVDGAGLNDIALTSTERDGVAQLFTGCVDAEEMLGALVLGGDNMAPSEAACMARGLADTTVAASIVRSWIYNTGYDPVGEDGAEAQTLLAQAAVCLPSDVFLFNGLQLPGSDPEADDSVTSGTTPVSEGTTAVGGEAPGS
ncbi:MAG: hypothetical protein R2716_11690 [Microthrixaceae bacterium]